METPAVVRTPHALGPAVRDARRAAGLTQTELARRARVGRTWLSQFEDGQKTSAPLDMVFRLLAELELPLEIQAVRLP
ncbi:MAG: helix-turn-helix domain-containing protein [Propionibacteriaceae bacterium]|jgi:transcriptional regulator with XRE-family HTH domain|nr:helix-turn-helix domain-containing protein [Propionibacteriaceae bacterium]